MPMTNDELRALPATVSLTTAARALGCGRTLAYDLARRGQFPCRVLHLGRRYRVPTADLLHALGLPPEGLTTQAHVIAAPPAATAAATAHR
jgi:hypothetical protein